MGRRILDIKWKLWQRPSEVHPPLKVQEAITSVLAQCNTINRRTVEISVDDDELFKDSTTGQLSLCWTVRFQAIDGPNYFSELEKLYRRYLNALVAGTPKLRDHLENGIKKERKNRYTPAPEILQLQMTEMEIYTRSINTLHVADIRTLADILEREKDLLLTMNNVQYWGPDRRQNLIDAMEELGFKVIAGQFICVGPPVIPQSIKVPAAVMAKPMSELKVLKTVFPILARANCRTIGDYLGSDIGIYYWQKLRPSRLSYIQRSAIAGAICSEGFDRHPLTLRYTGVPSKPEKH